MAKMLKYFGPGLLIFAAIYAFQTTRYEAPISPDATNHISGVLIRQPKERHFKHSTEWVLAIKDHHSYFILGGCLSADWITKHISDLHVGDSVSLYASRVSDSSFF